MPRQPFTEERAQGTGRLPTVFELLSSTKAVSADKPAAGRWRRLVVTIPLLVVLGTLNACNRLALALDRLLFPAFRRVSVKRPLFIIGPPRSGTTLLHRLVASDSQQFTTFPLWELLFAPAICQKYLVLGLDRFDRWVGGPLGWLLRRTERIVFGSSERIHKTSLLLPEEDYLLLLPLRACFLLILAFPRCEGLWRLGRFDEAISPDVRRRVMKHYASLLQRHLYVRGTQRCILSKNPCFSSWIESLNEQFPEARFVGLLRPAEETVPSQLSSIGDEIRVFGDRVQDPKLVGRFMDLLAYYYEHVIESLEAWPKSRAILVRYQDLIALPAETAADSLAQLGYDVSSGFRTQLHAAERDVRQYRSRHRYALSEFGLSEAQIRDRFRAWAVDSGDTSADPSSGPEIRDSIFTGACHDRSTASTG
jgi:omega-hydroxy-beta-dihydromenaquinone-9 sulfotransferase